MKAVNTLAILVCAVGAATSVNAAVITSTGDSFADFSVTAGWASGDYGVSANNGLTGAGDNAIFFVPRTTNDHVLTWNVSAPLSSADSLTFDVRNLLALGTANLTVRIYYDGGSIYSPTYLLSTNNYENHVTTPLPGNHTIDKIAFVVTENTKVVYLDNLSLNYTPVPEPASFGVLGLGSLAMLRRRRR